MICKVVNKNDTEAYIELMNGYIEKVPLSTLPEGSSIGELITIDGIMPNNIFNEKTIDFL